VTRAHLEALCSAIRGQWDSAALGVGEIMERGEGTDAWAQTHETQVPAGDVWLAAYRWAMEQQQFGSIADVGCGHGRRCALALGDRDCHVTLIDACRTNLETAGNQFGERTVECYEGDAATPGFRPPHQADLVLVMEVLEHCADPCAVLRNAHSWTAPGGLLIVSSPNRAFWIAAGIYQAGDITPNTTHRREWCPDELLRMVAETLGSVHTVTAPWSTKWDTEVQRPEYIDALADGFSFSGTTHSLAFSPITLIAIKGAS